MQLPFLNWLYFLMIVSICFVMVFNYKFESSADRIGTSLEISHFCYTFFAFYYIFTTFNVNYSDFKNLTLPLAHDCIILSLRKLETLSFLSFPSHSHFCSYICLFSLSPIFILSFRPLFIISRSLCLLLRF